MDNLTTLHLKQISLKEKLKEVKRILEKLETENLWLEKEIEEKIKHLD